MIKRIVSLLLVLTTFLIISPIFVFSGGEEEEKVPGAVVTPKGKVFKFGIDADYPPWSWYEEGEFHGMDVEVLKAIIEHSGIEVEFVALPWETAVPALGAGKIDLLAGAMYLTCEREKVIDFTRPYFREHGFVIVKKGSEHNIATALSGGSRVAGMAGGTQYEWLQSLIEQNVDIIAVPYETDELALKDLEAGRVDAMVSDETVAYDYLKQYNIEVAGKIYKGYSFEVVYGVKKGDPDNLISLINDGLKWLWETGKFQALWYEIIGSEMQPLGPLPLERETICE